MIKGNNPPLCINCRHFISMSEESIAGMIAKNAQKHMCSMTLFASDTPDKNDLVTGSKFQISIKSCEQERRELGNCKREGKLYEPKYC